MEYGLGDKEIYINFEQNQLEDQADRIIALR
jgi:hypothetical protein